MVLTVSGIPAEMRLQQLLTAVHLDKWLQEELFQFQWWFLLGLYILTVAAWWKMLNKQRLPEIILYAVLTTIITMGIDEYGIELTLWTYPVCILPIFPVITAINLIALPTCFSIAYQRFPAWKSFACASILIAGVLAFVLEPLLAWANLYQLITWQYYYSFLLYITIALFIRWSVITILDIAARAQGHPD
ncbi:hypothetical protein SPTER_04650 [Sporomusa termitida]|uniref:Uncharacterized protein n=2 Tax=Sporomusa termitida TaxID=2377 RepID=A0A517DPH9_9FIRM|nr:hypothetical protein SPTER_04650 [Sporomusa termitida]